jgi:hypothetical protein
LIYTYIIFYMMVFRCKNWARCRCLLVHAKQKYCDLTRTWLWCAGLVVRSPIRWSRRSNTWLVFRRFQILHFCPNFCKHVCCVLLGKHAWDVEATQGVFYKYVFYFLWRWVIWKYNKTIWVLLWKNIRDVVMVSGCLIQICFLDFFQNVTNT